MQAVFIRHNCSSTPQILQQLWDRRLIALHYTDSLSIKPDDYNPSGKQSIRRLLSYCKAGALVGADYRYLNKVAMLVGILPKGSKIRAGKYRDSKTGQSFIYKVAELHDAREVNFADFPLLLGVQPRQATITGWPAAAMVLEAALNNKAIPFNISCLHPSQIEVLCYEWLREKYHLDRLIMPIGRNLIDIDILGLDKSGNKVLAQVTHSMSKSDLIDKRKRLLLHAKHSDTCFFFAPDNAPIDCLHGVVSIPLSQVLSELHASKDVSTKRMLSVIFHS